MLRTMHHTLLPLILGNHAPFNGHVKDIDIRGGELARTDVLLKEEIDLGEGAAARLGDAEVGVDDAAEADARPEEAGEVAPVPGAWVEHVGGEDGADYADLWEGGVSWEHRRSEKDK